MTDAELDAWIKEVRERCERAIGPHWYLTNDGARGFNRSEISEKWGSKSHSKYSIRQSDHRAVAISFGSLENAEFIADSRTDLPRALEIIEELREKIQELEANLKAIELGM